MPNIYLCGHGWWKTIGSSSPFTVVPQGTTLSVYTPVGRYLDPGIAYAVMTGDQTNAPALPADQVFGPHRSCPDTLLRPVHEQMVRQVFMQAEGQGVPVRMVNQDTRLSVLLQEYQGYHVHWMACRPRLGDKAVEQGGFNDDYLPHLGMVGGVPARLRNR